MSRVALFVCDDAAILTSQGLRPRVIPILFQLQAAGVRLIQAPFWSNGEALSVLRSQGLEFESYQPGAAFNGKASIVIAESDIALNWASALGVRAMAADWPQVAQAILAEVSCRRARVVRKTRETEVDVSVDLDRAQLPQAKTGIGFFDHMLEQLGAHGGFTLLVTVKGDLEVDDHHTVEDTALALGEALRRALGNKRGIHRYGFTLPMDEALAEAAIDLGGRSVSSFKGKFPRRKVGGLAVEMVPHFFKSLADALGASLHVSVRGDNAHHMVEAVFKVLGRCLRQALALDGSQLLPSTKGIL